MGESDENYIYIHIYISNITQQIEISSHTLNRIISENEMVVSNNNFKQFLELVYVWREGKLNA